jgi:uncharacterized iron-regulated membrane protein
MALFLVVEGLTGSLLAFERPLTRWLAPQTFAAAPSPAAKMLSLGELAEAAERIGYPRARVGYFFDPSEGRAVMRMAPRTDPTTGKRYDIDYGWLVLDPWTGREIARMPESRSPGGFTASIMPFVYQLHICLALGATGVWILGIVALLWTIDCFAAVYLTLPVSLRCFWQRWRIAWKLKWPASFFRINFDLHRASGLWLWALLFVFAWSSVQLTLTQVYDPVTGALFDFLTPDQEISLLPNHPTERPLLGWRAAQQAGDRIVSARAQLEGFEVERPITLAYFESSGIYSYSVRTNRPFPSFSEYNIYFDGNTGRLVSINRASGQHTGNTVTSWLRALHFVSDPVDKLAYRSLVGVLGVVVAGLAWTGVYIWWRKRRARRWVRTRAADSVETRTCNSKRHSHLVERTT